MSPQRLVATAVAPALCAVALGCSGPAALGSSNRRPAPPPTAAESPATGPVRTTSRFAVWSDPDVNLHHFLYQWARSLSEHGGRLSVAERADLADLSGPEQRAWSAALEHYRVHLVSRSLIFSLELAELRDYLARTGPASAAAALESAEARAAVEVLDSVRPIYRRRWWRLHDEANRAWIDSVVPVVEPMERAVIARLESIYGASWPPGLIRIDVSAYAGDVGAYTNYYGSPAGPAPPHATISSTSPGNRLPQGVEIVFHEALHSDAMEGTMNAALAAAFGDRPPPRRLWHRILFYTAGEVVRDAYAAAGSAGYRTYSEENGLWTRSAEAERALRVLDEHWKPFLDGQGTREEALAKVADALGAVPEGS